MESCALCLQWHWPKQCSSNTFCTLWHSARRWAQIFLNDFSKHIQLERRVVFLCQRPMDDAWREPQDTSRDTSRNLSANLSGTLSLGNYRPSLLRRKRCHRGRANLTMNTWSRSQRPRFSRQSRRDPTGGRLKSWKTGCTKGMEFSGLGAISCWLDLCPDRLL